MCIEYIDMSGQPYVDPVLGTRPPPGPERNAYDRKLFVSLGLVDSDDESEEGIGVRVQRLPGRLYIGDPPVEMPGPTKNKTDLAPEDLSDSVRKNPAHEYLYPQTGKPGFSRDLASRQEFYDTRYLKPSGTVERLASELCDASFELAPHQLFVRSFLSAQTPYNGALLYHGLGSGKTCSAIGVAEEMRDYMNQMGISQRIIVVASPNVQENFKLQLFDESKLVEEDGLWNMRACTGNKFIKEVNPTGLRGVSRARIVSQVNRIINTNYLFLGYIEFANYIAKQACVPADLPEKKRAAMIRDQLSRTFGSRLIIIDEIHNIRLAEENRDKRVAAELDRLTENVSGMRLLFLSATPMYNSPKEIVWLLNILRRNDRREALSAKQIFNNDGTFVTGTDGDEIGRKLLADRASGYVSFVKGGNPYTFPYRIWPSMFDPERTFPAVQRPTIQLNDMPIPAPLERVDLYMTPLGPEQQAVYAFIMEKFRGGDFGHLDNVNKMFSEMESFGYTMLQRPLECLNIAYPMEDGSTVKELVGKGGLDSVVTYKETSVPPQRFDFAYKLGAPRVFSRDMIGRYSGKIATIISNVESSEGIVLVYSQYIDGGLVPIALALEEAGYQRRGSGRSLFAQGIAPATQSAGYVMITGDRAFTPDPVADLKEATAKDNRDGTKVKVVLISQAGSEGLDFKNIRQVHVLEPWYNMNRIEQIIGRGVRTCSHMDLPFEKRNVQLFLHGTQMPDTAIEAADVYVYRLAETKALQIGRVSRTLKEGAVDCFLNLERQEFAADLMGVQVSQSLSNGKAIVFEVGDKPFSAECDYMEACQYACSGGPPIEASEVTNMSYDGSYARVNIDRIMQRVRSLMKERYVYRRDELIAELHIHRGWPIVQIDSALSRLIDDRGETIVDQYGRLGKLVNIGMFYLFQPLEIKDDYISVMERSTPVSYRRKYLSFGTPSDVQEVTSDVSQQKDLEAAILSYSSESKAPDEWADLVNEAVGFLRTGYEITDPEVEAGIVGHYTDLMGIDEIGEVLSSETSPSREYLLEKAMYEEGLVGIGVDSDDGYRILRSSDGGGTWGLATPEEKYLLMKATVPLVEAAYPVADKFPKYVGYMGRFKDGAMVFKTKQMDHTRSSGARCDQAKTRGSFEILNSVLPDAEFQMRKGIRQSMLCVALELLFRSLENRGTLGKKWFVRPADGLLIGISKLHYGSKLKKK